MLDFTKMFEIFARHLSERWMRAMALVITILLAFYLLILLLNQLQPIIDSTRSHSTFGLFVYFFDRYVYPVIIFLSMMVAMASLVILADAKQQLRSALHSFEEAERIREEVISQLEEVKILHAEVVKEREELQVLRDAIEAAASEETKPAIPDSRSDT